MNFNEQTLYKQSNCPIYPKIYRAWNGYRYLNTHLHPWKFSFTQIHQFADAKRLQTAFEIDCKAEGASQKVKLDHIHLISEDFNPRWAQTNHQETQADQGFILCLERRSRLSFCCVCVHPTASFGEKGTGNCMCREHRRGSVSLTKSLINERTPRTPRCLGKFEMGIYRPNPIRAVGRDAPDLLKSSHSHSFTCTDIIFHSSSAFLSSTICSSTAIKQPFQQTIWLLLCCLCLTLVLFL